MAPSTDRPLEDQGHVQQSAQPNGITVPDQNGGIARLSQLMLEGWTMCTYTAVFYLCGVDTNTVQNITHITNLCLCDCVRINDNL